MKRSLLSLILLISSYCFYAQVCPTISVSTSSITCYGFTNGSATVVITSGGTAPFNYTWSPSGGNASSASGLSPGNYTAYVSDASTCAVVGYSFSIIQPNIFVSISTQTNPSCWGGAGVVSFTSIGGSPPYSYTWFPTGGNGSTASISAGSYTLLVKDANSCTIAPTATVTEPPNLFTTVSVTNAICGSTLGVGSVTATGGVGPYTYTWSPGGASTTTVALSTTGIYSISVKDASNCVTSNTVSFLKTTQPTLAISSTSVKCNGANNGSATVTINGGLSPYTYTWTGSASTASTASGLSPGNYTVSVKDATNCAASITFTITQPPAITVSASQNTILCNGGTGTASISLSGGVTPYTYTWSPTGGNAASATLSAGLYTVTGRDANLCTITQTFNFTQPAALAATSSQTNVTCNGASTGAASLNITGGTTPYGYSWAPSGGSSFSASGLPAGTYTVTVTDNHLCILTVTVPITEPTAMLATSNTSSVACNGQSTGAATLNVTGGTGAYTYTWNPTGGNSFTANALPANTYSVVVKDANNCTKTFTVPILGPSAISPTLQLTNITCHNANDGIANVIVSGGMAPYTYSWSPGTSVSPSISALAPNIYTVTIRDANLCVKSQTFQVTNPPQYSISISGSNALCAGQSSGSATVTVAGGVPGPGYIYLWNPSGATSSVATGLAAGDHTVTIQDANNCIANVTVNISEPPALSGTAITTSASCNNSDGSATLTVSGGTGNYTYSWSPSGGSASTASNIPAGQYTVTVTDQNNCQLAVTVTVSANSPTLGVSISNATICSGGSTTLTATGGSSYTWSPAAGLSAVNGSLVVASVTVPTTYSVTSDFSNGCSVTVTVQVQLFPSTIPAASFTSTGLCAGSPATLTASGGQSYTWSPAAGLSSAFVSSPTFTLGNTTTYTVTALDNIGCTASQTVLVNPLPFPVVAISGNTAICAGETTTITLSGAVSYTWGAQGPVTPSLALNQASVYPVSATGTNNCVGTIMVPIVVNPLPTISIQSGTVLCKGNTATLSASGASTYTWSNGATGVTITDTPTSNTTYVVQGTDANGCTNSVSFGLTVFATPTISILGKKEACASEKVTLVATGASTYTWSTGDMTTSVSYAFNSNTVVTVSSGLGNCTPGTASISILINPSPTLAVAAGSTSIYYGQSTQISATSDGTLFTWTPATGLSCSNCLSPIAQPSVTTSYTLESSRKTCKTTSVITIQVDNTCGELFAPTAFSPNEDANNDTWCIYGNCIQTMECEIFNRWGQKVFTISEKTQCWDGKVGGVMQNAGVFIYQASIVLSNGETKSIKGNFTLVR